MFSVNAAFHAADIVLTEPSGASKVSVTTRSAPNSYRIGDIRRVR